MKLPYRNIGAVVAAAFWINASEFFRNEVLVSDQWAAHYRTLGTTLPSAPVNGALWVVWGSLFALSLFLLSRRFSLAATTLIGWLMAFVLMWLVAWNLKVLPLGILPYAVPLSLLEVFVGSYICIRTAPR